MVNTHQMRAQGFDRSVSLPSNAGEVNLGDIFRHSSWTFDLFEPVLGGEGAPRVIELA